MFHRIAAVFLIGALFSSAACASSARLPVAAGMGPNPVLPAPKTSLIPTIKVATAKGWAATETPAAAPGTSVVAFATDLQHPRWLYLLPNGDVLVAETNAPARPDVSPGFKGWFFNRFQKKAGAAAPSADRITLLRDQDGDGTIDERSIFLSVPSPFGMVLVDNTFYVATADAVLAFPYSDGQLRIEGAAKKVIDLPGGTINYHWTKNLIASPDGSKLYVAVGSNSNIAERGFDKEVERAAVWEIDRATGRHRIFASGLRNPVGMAWVPERGALWVAVNERDDLGSDLVPDYMTALRDGGFYGWPYSYYGQHVDKRVKKQRPDLVAQAIVPDYALGPHTASLGLAYSNGKFGDARFANGMFVAQHGSWNRNPRSGYKVIFVPFRDGVPDGDPLDVLTGFLDERDGDARGRPAGLALDKSGALLVADDVGNVVWRVSPRAQTPPARKGER